MATITILEQVLQQHKPKLVMLNLGETDGGGHSGYWTRYTDAIQNADKFIYYLWLKLQSMPKYKDKTTMIIVNDHGRNLDGVGVGFKGHGCPCEGCKHVFFSTRQGADRDAS